jgi:hypothetical protein
MVIDVPFWSEHDHNEVKVKLLTKLEFALKNDF